MGNCELYVTVFVVINDTVRCISISSLKFEILCKYSGKSISVPLSVLDGL